MIKIWAKTLLEEKITRDIIFSSEEKYNANNLYNYLVQICEQLDIPTPLVLTSHIANYSQFNITTFRTGDFVETIDFDLLILENASDA